MASILALDDILCALDDALMDISAPIRSFVH